MALLNSIERLGETRVVIMNLRGPLDIRGSRIIPASAKSTSAYQLFFFSQKGTDIADRFSMGIRSRLGLGPLTCPLPTTLRLKVFSLKERFGVDTGSEISPWFNAWRISDGREMGGKLMSS